MGRRVTVVVGQIQRGSAGPWSNGASQIDRQIRALGQIGQIGRGPGKKSKKQGKNQKNGGKFKKNGGPLVKLSTPPGGPLVAFGSN